MILRKDEELARSNKFFSTTFLSGGVLDHSLLHSVISMAIFEHGDFTR